MNPFDYIHVAMHGHFDDKLSVRYTFNGSDGSSQRWEGSLPDPDAIVRNFMSARECYVMWQNPMGHYFGIITADPMDPRAGRVMVTIMVDNGDAVAGRAIFSALSGLKKAFLEDRLLSDDAVRKVLQSVGFPEAPMKLASWNYNRPDEGARLSPICYRTYLSTRELETVFSFPNQPEYKRFHYIVVITATASLRPGVSVDRITAPVKKQYTVVCPDNVSASQEIVDEGDHLTLTFTKDGFNPRKENVTIGSPSPYVRTDGSALIIKTAEESGMSFTRKVRLSVRSAKGGAINGYTMSVNDRTVNTMEPFVELNETDFQPGKRVEIQVASNNFQPLKQSYEPAELMRQSAIELVLQPLEEGIVLRLDFGEGRVFEQQISLEKNTPEYSQLRGGNFHGFRAHRQAGQGEIYNVDVRSASKPVAPNFDNVASRDDRDESRRRVVPVFPKAGEAERKTADTPRETVAAEKKPSLIEKLRAGKEAEKESAAKSAEVKAPERPRGPYDKPAGDEGENSNIIKWICVGVCIIAVILGAIYILKPVDSDKAAGAAAAVDSVSAVAQDAPATAQPAAQSAAQPAAAQPVQQSGVSADEQADIDYFNANRSWRRDALKSDSGRKLYDAIVAGKITEIVNHPYFATAGRSTNKDANNVADLIWAATGTPNEGGNSIALTKAEKGGAINLWDLYEALARRKPAEPNANPRPGK